MHVASVSLASVSLVEYKMPGMIGVGNGLRFAKLEVVDDSVDIRFL